MPKMSRTKMVVPVDRQAGAKPQEKVIDVADEAVDLYKRRGWKLATSPAARPPKPPAK